MKKIREIMNRIEKQYLEGDVVFQEFCETITGADLSELTLSEIIEIYGALSNKIDGDIVKRENIEDDISVYYGKNLLGKDFTEGDKMNKIEKFFTSEHDFAWEQLGTATDCIESIFTNAYSDAIDRLEAQYDKLGSGFQAWLYTEKQVAEQDLLTAVNEEEHLEKDAYLSAINRCWYELFAAKIMPEIDEEVPF